MQLNEIETKKKKKNECKMTPNNGENAKQKNERTEITTTTNIENEIYISNAMHFFVCAFYSFALFILFK